MNNADQILLIVLAIVIIIFFILVIWALAYFVQFMKSAKRIAASAEKIVDSAETAAEAFKNVSGPVAFFRMINNLGKIIKKEKDGKK